MTENAELELIKQCIEGYCTFEECVKMGGTLELFEKHGVHLPDHLAEKFKPEILQAERERLQKLSLEP